MDLKQEIIKASREIFSEVREMRRHLHRHPELSFNEKETSAYIRKVLDQWGVEYTYPFAETGLLARIEGNMGKGKIIALRTDLDGLPIKEENDVEYRSVNDGVMHACGHDVHMSTMLGTVKLLNRMKEHFAGTVLVIFQPGEEKAPGGAKLMLEEGLFSNIEPDLILAQHVMPDMNAGDAGFKPGMYMASSNEIYITVKGKGGHGALPEKIDDPVLIASHILISLQQEIHRKAPRGVPTVLSFGKVIADGAVNVIPDHVSLEGTFRTMDEKWRKEAHGLITRIVEGLASGMGGTAEVDIKEGYPVLYNDPGITEKARGFALELLGEEHITDMDIRMTSEDFAWFSQKYPAMMYRLGVKASKSEEIYPLHTNTFRIDEKALETGTALMSWLAISFLNS